MEQVGKDLDGIKTDVKCLSKKLDTKFTALIYQLEDREKMYDKKYANKLTEKLVFGVAGMILVAAVAALVKLVIT